MSSASVTLSRRQQRFNILSLAKADGDSGSNEKAPVMRGLSPVLRESVERSSRYWSGQLDQVDLRITLRWAHQQLQEARKQLQESLGGGLALAERQLALQQLELLEQLESSLQNLDVEESAAAQLHSLSQRWEGLQASTQLAADQDSPRCSRCQNVMAPSHSSCEHCGWSPGEAREATGKSEVQVSPDLFELHRRCRAWLHNELPPEEVLSWVLGLQTRYQLALEQLRQSPPPEAHAEGWRGLQRALLDLLDGLLSVQEAVQGCRPEAVTSAWNLLLMGFDSFQQQAELLQRGAAPPGE